MARHPWRGGDGGVGGGLIGGAWRLERRGGVRCVRTEEVPRTRDWHTTSACMEHPRRDRETPRV